MENEDRALKGTQNAWYTWQVVYVGTFFVFLLRVACFVVDIPSRPFSWWHAVGGGIGPFLALVPLLMGLAFRKLLKDELGKEMLSARTYRICDYRIAQLLLFTYFTMMVYVH
jgi:hypothetical protein